MQRWNVALTVLIVLCLCYIAPYLVLSRRGYAEADRLRMVGFYYFTPVNSDEWHSKNRLCRTIFWPLNCVDCVLGFGRPAAYDPLWEIE